MKTLYWIIILIGVAVLGGLIGYLLSRKKGDSNRVMCVPHATYTDKEICYEKHCGLNMAVEYVKGEPNWNNAFTMDDSSFEEVIALMKNKTN